MSPCFIHVKFCVICKHLKLPGKRASNKLLNEEQNVSFKFVEDILFFFGSCSLTQRAREISTFVTPNGLYQYKVMLFGMKNAPATFQRMVNKLVRDIDGCEGYIDDVVIYSDNWSDHIRQIKRFFQIMREAKLTIT